MHLLIWWTVLHWVWWVFVFLSSTYSAKIFRTIYCKGECVHLLLYFQLFRPASRLWSLQSVKREGYRMVLYSMKIRHFLEGLRKYFLVESFFDRLSCELEFCTVRNGNISEEWGYAWPFMLAAKCKTLFTSSGNLRELDLRNLTTTFHPCFVQDGRYTLWERKHEQHKWSEGCFVV